MPSLALYSGFVAAAAVLLLIPGPNVALIVANSIAHGRKFGLVTVMGTSSAMVVQLGLTVLGMTALMGAMAQWFAWLRWVGVLYLIYLGVRAWRAAPVDLERTPPQPRSLTSIFLRGFLVSATNPKTLLFYSAFLPQFLEPDVPLLPQLLLLAATFLVLAVVFDSSWALLAARVRHLLAAKGRLRNRLTGASLIGAGLGLALARKS